MCDMKLLKINLNLFVVWADKVMENVKNRKNRTELNRYTGKCHMKTENIHR